MAFDPNDPKDVEFLQGEIDKAIAAAVDGLKKKNNELILDEKKLKATIKEIQEKYNGIDADEIRQLLSRIQNDEDAKLISEGKVQDVIERRVERMRKDFETQLQAANNEVAKARAFTHTFKETVLSSAIKDAATKAGCMPEAAEDFVLRGSRLFSVDDEGKVTCIDKDGKAIFGKDGKTALSPEEWAESLRETAPHLWPKANGSNANGSGGSAANKSYSEMTEAERTHLYKTDKAKFDRLKSEAGTAKPKAK